MHQEQIQIWHDSKHEWAYVRINLHKDRQAFSVSAAVLPTDLRFLLPEGNGIGLCMNHLFVL